MSTGGWLTFPRVAWALLAGVMFLALAYFVFDSVFGVLDTDSVGRRRDRDSEPLRLRQGQRPGEALLLIHARRTEDGRWLLLHAEKAVRKLDGLAAVGQQASTPSMSRR